MDRTVELRQFPSYDARHIGLSIAVFLVELGCMTVVIGQLRCVGDA